MTSTEDAVVDVFLYAVVHRALTRGRSCAVVVDAESATAVDEVDVISHLVQLDVELRGLAQGGLYAANLRDLRADVEVDEAQTVAHALLIEQLEGFEQLGTGQSELRGVAAALFPLAATARCQLDAYADVRAYTQLLCFASDELKLVHLLHDDENLLAHLLSEQRQLDVRLVLVAVADDDGVALALHGDDGMQLRLRAGFQSEVELPAVRDDLLDDRLHLVHLDGIHHIVLSLVVVLLRSLLEAAPRFLDAVVEDVGKAQQHRWCDIAQGEFIHHFAQVNLRLVLTGRHVDVALLVYSEIRSAPTIQVVEFLRVFNRPFLHFVSALYGD